MGLVEAIFWASSALLAYPYVGYPMLMLIVRLVKGRRGKLTEPDKWPSVTIVISAYNEEDVISSKLENALAQDYQGQLEILVVSDASTDRTDETVAEFASEYDDVRLIRQNERFGKSIGINKALSVASGDLVLFTDANAMFEPAATSEIVRAFGDESVGYVVGAARYTNATSSAQAKEAQYWNFELWLKELESDCFSVVGGDGAIYAIRRQLFWDLRADDINDFVNPLQIVANGYVGVFDGAAVCYEAAGVDFDKEFGRKRRIVNRSWRATLRNLPRFSVIDHLGFLFELFSHKVLRWLGMFFLIVAAICNVILIFSGAWIYQLSMVALLSLGLGAAAGRLMRDSDNRLASALGLPYYFVLSNWAATLGIVDWFAGRNYVTWDHIRSKTHLEKEEEDPLAR